MDRKLYLDCGSGISGDMFVGAMLALGADLDGLKKKLSSLELEGYEIGSRVVQKCGITATKFDVILENEGPVPGYLGAAEAVSVKEGGGHVHGPDGHHHHHDHAHAHSHDHDDSHEPDGHHHHHDHAHAHDHDHSHGSDGHHHHHDHDDSHGSDGHHHHHDHDDSHGSDGHHHHHDHDHLHDHDHSHRNLASVHSILRSGDLSPEEVDLAIQIFGWVARSEGAVHGLPPEEVFFHEVGAVDSIIDIAAAAICFLELGIREVIIPHITEGGGQVRCQHGIMPVPVPAVVDILANSGLVIRNSDIRSELITPTGAAIAATLVTSHNLPATYRVVRYGYGAGHKDFAAPNILRAMIIEAVEV